MGNLVCFVFFLIFNIFLGLSGLGIIGYSVYSIITKIFNLLFISLISLGGFKVLIFLFGLCSRKNKCLLVINITFTLIIFLFYSFLSAMEFFYSDKVYIFVKEKLEAKIPEIKTENMLLFIIACSMASLCLLSFIFGICYCCGSKDGKEDEDYKNVTEEVNQGEEIGPITDNQQEEEN